MMPKINIFQIASTGLLLLISWSSIPQAAPLNQPPLNESAIAEPGTEWLSYGRDYNETRHSPLTQIKRESVKDLDLIWSFQFPTARVMESTPLMHRGVLYVTTAWSQVYALDARSGKQLWSFDPQVNKAHLVKACCGPANRGVALWQTNDAGKLQLFFAALDGRLFALDAATGQKDWSVQTTPIETNYSITGAPRVVNGLVIIGNGGADLGVRGYVSAYDAVTGELRWRFYTVPGDPAKPQENSALDAALETWSGDYWYQNGGGGGTAWDSLVYDPELNLIYIGTGNGSPWNREIRSPGGGDNLYLSSIVALNADTGDYVWHYQVTPQDNWDYTATQQLVLADLEIQGQLRKVIMQAPKNGFFYVLDRQSGELLSADTYTNISWASHVDMETGRPVETEFAHYQKNGGSIIWPGPIGAHNWQPMSFSPQTGLMYIPVQNGPGYYSVDEKVSYGIGRWNTGVDFDGNRDPRSWVTAKATRDALLYGELVAWDPIRQKRVWQVRHTHVANGGVLSTGGDLVFQGTKEGLFAAYDAHNGDLLWQFQSDSSVLAGPISYELDGEQYIAVTQGSGGAVILAAGGDELLSARINPNRLLVFKLGNFGHEPVQINSSLAEIKDVPHPFSAEPELLEEGGKLYERNCSVCHGISAKGNAVVPDLRYMDSKTHAEFVAIAFGGLLAHQGMVGFHKNLSLDEIEMIHAYLDKEQQQLAEKQSMTFLQKVEYWLVYWGAKLGEQFPSLANASRDYVM